MGSDTNSVLIVAGGRVPDGDFLLGVARHFERIIAADAGLDAVLAAGLKADCVVGDFDSVHSESLKNIPTERRRHEPDQSDTDLEKAIRLALEWGADRIGVVGVTGDRIDHTINTLSLMIRYEDRAQFELFDAHGRGVLAHPPEVVIHGQVGDLVSLVPAPSAHGVRSEGLKYPLDGIDLEFGGRDGISNELTASPAVVRFQLGRLLIYTQHS